jgi:uncharacterized oxidoreductase
LGLENRSDLNVQQNNAGIQVFIDDFYEKATAEITTNIVAQLHLTSFYKTKVIEYNY